MPRSSLGILLVVALLATAATGHALTIKSASVVVHPIKGDRFAIKGELGPLDPPGLDFGAAATIVFELDGVVAGFGAAELKRTKTKLSYKGPSRAPGVSQLVIDLKKRRFSAKGSGLVFPALPATFMVRLRAGADAACALLPLGRLGKPPAKPPTKPKAVKFGLPKKHTGLPCLLAGRLRAEPPVVVVERATAVRFSAALAPGLVPDGGVVVVRRLDGGVAVEPPVCALVDDGGPASGDLVPGDRLYGCMATIDEAALGTASFVAQATVGGAPVGSAVLALPVVVEPTEADVAASFAAQTQARLAWDGIVATFGDTLNARLAALRQIAAIPGVADVQLGANGLDIAIRFSSGLRGGLLLNTRFGDPNVTSPAPPSTRDAAPAGSTAAAPPRGAAAACPVTPDRILIGNRKALVLTTSYFGAFDDWPLAESGFEGSCLPIDVTVQTLTRGSILAATPASAFFFSTHGFVDSDGSIAIVTDETATAEEVFLQSFHDPDKRYDSEIIGLPMDLFAGGRNVWMVRSAHLRRMPGRFDDAFVHASHCHSVEDPQEWAVFRSKGARAFFGFEGTTSNTFARVVTGSLIPDVAQHMLTTGEAFDRAVKTDPAPVARDPLAKGIVRVAAPPASSHLLGERQLAYVGKVTVAPATSTLDAGASVVLTPSVEDTGACELRHAWTNTARAGQISDGMGNGGGVFETVAPTVTYEAVGERQYEQTQRPISGAMSSRRTRTERKGR